MQNRGIESGLAQKQMEEIASQVAHRTAEEFIRQLHLENRTGLSTGTSEGENDMPKRLRENIAVNGKSFWVTGMSIDKPIKRKNGLFSVENSSVIHRNQLKMRKLSTVCNTH